MYFHCNPIHPIPSHLLQPLSDFFQLLDRVQNIICNFSCDAEYRIAVQLQLSGGVQNNSCNYSCQEGYRISAAITAVRKSTEYQLQLQLSGRVYNIIFNYSAQAEHRIQSTLHLAGGVQVITARTIFQKECRISAVTTTARQSTKYQLPLTFFRHSVNYQLPENISSIFSSRQSAECQLLFQLSGKVHCKHIVTKILNKYSKK